MPPPGLGDVVVGFPGPVVVGVIVVGVGLPEPPPGWVTLVDGLPEPPEPPVPPLDVVGVVPEPVLGDVGDGDGRVVPVVGVLDAGGVVEGLWPGSCGWSDVGGDGAAAFVVGDVEGGTADRGPWSGSVPAGQAVVQKFDVAASWPMSLLTRATLAIVADRSST